MTIYLEKNVLIKPLALVDLVGTWNFVNSSSSKAGVSVSGKIKFEHPSFVGESDEK